ncbi:hypothetical protein SAMN05421505_120111 [Sinosporangium album]|uniref:Uncharacterized protein n=1 Tax=Sinosporangium album TaxID=504805 RepID=A0A1G8EI42_9ACTN|nr:DUF6221 family protein [Sinosporangium album]SDH69547.1 hypothetical protein SAMN05421505_120111 [Sinosporangium album]
MNHPGIAEYLTALRDELARAAPHVLARQAAALAGLDAILRGKNPEPRHKPGDHVTRDIRAFITARLDEDEQIARAALLGTHGAWDCYTDNLGNLHVEYAVTGPSVAPLGDARWPGAHDRGRHIARHDPARALRDVAAKRKILERHRPRPTAGAACRGCGLDAHEEPAATDVARCPVLLALAEVYADHPDYLAEWATPPAAGDQTGRKCPDWCGCHDDTTETDR